jgi:hypothetical protein
MVGARTVSDASGRSVEVAVLLNDLGQVEARVEVCPSQRFIELPDPSRRLRLVRRFVRRRLETEGGERIFVLHEVVDPRLNLGKLLRGDFDVDD